MTSVFELRQKNASNRNRMRFYHIIFSNSMLLLLSVVSPLHIHGSPGKSCAECSENKVVAFLQLIFKVPDAKRQRSSTGIAVTFDINQYFLTRNFQTMCHSINDTEDWPGAESPSQCYPLSDRFSRNGRANIRHIGYGILKHSTSFLINVMHVVVYSKIRGRTNRPPAFICRKGKPLPSVLRIASIIPTSSVVGSSMKAAAPSPKIGQVARSV